jgi:hypothetical protein
MKQPDFEPPCVTIEKHAPERRNPRVITTHCGCCCCSCCCLHTVGGAIGAALGSSPVSTLRDQEYLVPDESSPGQYRTIRTRGPADTSRAITLYWVILGSGCILTVLFGFVEGRFGAPWLGFAYLIMCGPAIQAGVSLVHLIILALIGGWREEYLQAGRIFLWTFLGALLGTAVMYGVCLGPSLFR